MNKVISVFCCIAMLFGLSGCGSSSTSSSTVASTTDYSNSTLTGEVTAISGNTVTLTLGTISENEMITGEDFEGSELPEGADDADFSREMPEGDAEMDMEEVPDDFDADAMPEGAEGQMGEIPTESEDGTAPELPDGESTEDGELPSDLPEGEMGEMTEMDDIAEMGDMGDMAEMGDTGEMGDMPDGNNAMDARTNAMGGMDAIGGMGGFSMVTFSAGEEVATIDLTGASVSIEDATGTSEGSIEDIAVGDVLVIEVGDNNAVTSVTIKLIMSADVDDMMNFDVYDKSETED